MIDGFYVGYMSAEGYGVVLFVFKDGNLAGVDAGGVRFDGSYSLMLGTNAYEGRVRVVAPPNIDLIQGFNTGPDGLAYEVPFTLPEGFLGLPFLQLKTPFGAVNIKLEKLRDLGAVV